ncbi:9369_t:CDS:2 [Acaulospora morrowiae]|uniref:9369_t:CDS:1 n=1 Tax=Acaulospora morrowiae TaxID=94023 RepID=A0A9N9H164_9GLOM|nr:9369_t:CDS:2 [Acaulospora morrowiae]
MNAMNNLIIYILSVALAFFIAPTLSLSLSNDPCARIAKKGVSHLYDDVKTCYLSTPFNVSVAKRTLQTLNDLFKDLYVFTDQSKEPVKEGFDFTPLDILSVLDTFLDKKSYSTDFEFNKDLRFTVKKLRDGHTDFQAGCYLNDIVFDQQIYLYSVVKDGKQIIKVFDDTIDGKNVDCEVTQINSKPALQAIKEFAQTQLSSSRDLGVRFNDALASVKEIAIATTSNQFSVRTDLPESDSITYTLECPNRRPFQFVRKWNITTVDRFLEWQDMKTFQSYCFSEFFLSYIPTQKKAVNSPPFTYGKAKQVYNALAANAYTLGEDIGIVEIGTFSFRRVHDSLAFEYQGAFQELAKRKVKKVVIDLSNNPGGSINFAVFLSGLIVPSKHFAFPTDLRVPPTIQQVIRNESRPESDGGFYNASSWNSFETGKPFENAEQFIGNRSLTRGGTTDEYSALFIDQLPDLLLEILKDQRKSPIQFPWDKDSTIILTNGHCASACALVSRYFAEIGQYPTVAVGGFLEQPLSFSTFPGGEVIDNGILTELPAYKPFISNVALDFTIREAYSLKNPNEVLDFQFRPATHRLYYDEKNSRDISLLWEQAADLLK